MPHFIANALEPLSYSIYTTAVLLRYRVDKQKKIKALVVYYTVVTVLMVYAAWAISLPDNDPRVNNNWIYNLQFLLPNVLLFYFFNLTLHSVRKRWVVRCLALLNVLLCIVNDFVLNHFHQFNSISNSFFSASMVVCILMYFHQVLTNISERDILLDFDFWLIAGYLLYFLGSFVIIVTYDYLSYEILQHQASESHQVLLGNLWGVGNILLFLSALITLIGHLWMQRRGKLH